MLLPPGLGEQRGPKRKPVDLAPHPPAAPHRPHLHRVEWHPGNHPAQRIPGRLQFGPKRFGLHLFPVVPVASVVRLRHLCRMSSTTRWGALPNCCTGKFTRNPPGLPFSFVSGSTLNPPTRIRKGFNLRKPTLFGESSGCLRLISCPNCSSETGVHSDLNSPNTRRNPLRISDSISICLGFEAEGAAVLPSFLLFFGGSRSSSG